jgi:hypothetical protein
MTHRDLISKILRDYYDSELMPSVWGGFGSSNWVQLFTAMMCLYDKQLKEMNAAKIWYDGLTVTWFTKQLHLMMNIPRFSDDTDSDFLDRVKNFQEAKEFGGQSNNSIITVVAGLLNEAIIKSNVSILTQDETAYHWSDPTPGPEVWDGSITWSDLGTILDVDFMITITFPLSGFDTDKYAYEYWQKAENYTKIQDVVRLFKPVGKKFKLLLVPPASRERYWRSNARVKVLAKEVSILSSTRISYIDNEVTSTSLSRILFPDNEITMGSETKIA